MRCVFQIGVAALVLAYSSAASAQVTVVRGLGGITFGTNTSSGLGGGVDVALNRNLFITGEAGRLQNVLPGYVEDTLDMLAAAISLREGIPVRFKATAPTLYGVGGIRFVTRSHSQVQPYAEAGIGVARINVQADASAGGVDLSGDIEDQAALRPFLEPMFRAGGGIAVSLTRAYAIEIGYRFNRIGVEGVNTSDVALGLRFGWR